MRLMPVEKIDRFAHESDSSTELSATRESEKRSSGRVNAIGLGIIDFFARYRPASASYRSMKIKYPTLLTPATFIPSKLMAY